MTLRKPSPCTFLWLLLAASLLGGDAVAGQHGFGVALSSFGPTDDDTEAIFDIDSGPIPTVFYRYRADAHSLAAGLGAESWERTDPLFRATIDFVPLFGTYRYTPWHDKPVSLVVGGGVASLFYDAEIVSGAGFGFFAESQTGALLALEPLVGVAFRAGAHVLIEAEYKYSLQLLTTDDFDGFQGFTDVDLSGTYATLGVSFLFGD